MKKPASKKTGTVPSLPFDFRQVARKIVQDHPELKKDILFVNAANDDHVAMPRTLEKLDEDDDAMEELKQTVKTAKRLKTSFAQAIALDSKHYVRAIVFHPDKHTLFDPVHKDIDHIGTMDHEAGHLLAPDAHGTHGENAADAYAILRHLQRFDGEKTGIDYAGWKRTMVFILSGKTSHLTTFTVDKILLDRKSADFVSLTPAQTAAVAKDYARKNTPGNKKLSKLAEDFKSAKAKRINHEVFRKIGTITLAADVTSDTFYLGARALLTPLSGEKITLDGNSVTLKGPEWQHLRARLDKKIATLPAQHPLRQRQNNTARP